VARRKRNYFNRQQMSKTLSTYHPVFTAIAAASEGGNIKIRATTDFTEIAADMVHGIAHNCMDLPTDKLREYWLREKEARATFSDWHLLNEPQRFVRVAEWVIACYVRKFVAGRLGCKLRQVDAVVKIISLLGSGEYFTSVDLVFARWPKPLPANSKLPRADFDNFNEG
jgi:hypothetical protein